MIEVDRAKEWGKKLSKTCIGMLKFMLNSWQYVVRIISITVQSLNILRPKNILNKRTQPPNNNNNHLCIRHVHVTYVNVFSIYSYYCLKNPHTMEWHDFCCRFCFMCLSFNIHSWVCHTVFFSVDIHNRLWNANTTSFFF